MNRDLRLALGRTGWDELYERVVPNLGRSSARGERAARCPLPDCTDTNASLFVNVQDEGKWNCFSCQRGGGFLQFCAYLWATEFDSTTGRSLPDFNATERRLLIEHGVAHPVDPTWVLRCRDRLWRDLALHNQIHQYKPWDQQTCFHLAVGYDDERDRITIPIFDRRGDLLNVRLYRPGGQPKIFWLASDLSGNFLFPHQAWQEETLILVEGEPDAITLRSYGFPACSGTMGADGVVPDGEWWRARHLFVLADADLAGQQATVRAAEQCRSLASSVHACTLPEWQGRPANADVSDYVTYLRMQGAGVESVQQAVGQIFRDATPVASAHEIFDAAPLPVTFGVALDSTNSTRRISFRARVTARSDKRYFLPTRFSLTCPAQGHDYCRRCPMRNTWHGNAAFTHDPRHGDTLRLIQSSDKEQVEAVKSTNGIVRSCPDPVLHIHESVNVEPIILNSTVIDSESERSVERKHREAFVIIANGHHLEENTDYAFEGFVYPSPRTQQGVFLLDRFQREVSTYDSFQLTPDLFHQLQSFRPSTSQSPYDKLVEVAEDLAQSITLIRGRLDLHLAYRTVWHSLLKFTLGGTSVQRGWIEALVVGDTRCGKSATFQRLAEHYGLGLLVDCKMQTVPGILGSVVTSQSTGERFVVPGILPQQDGRVVCFDEFHHPHGRGPALVDTLSSTRSEGVVRISKAASAAFPARVRSVWLANPGGGRLLHEMGGTGVELLPRIIPQPEDIARFDLALCVSQLDVPSALINQLVVPPLPMYSSSLSRSLLAWAYSRTPEQVFITAEAATHVLTTAHEMCVKYDATIPIVEPADQRTRVAKVAVSVAAQLFSTDDTGEYVVVLPQHVDCARQLFALWYDKPTMAYDVYSARSRQERTLRDPAAVRQIFDVQLAPHGKSFAEDLLRLDEFTERTFAVILPVQQSFARNVLQQLHAQRAVRLREWGRRESYELTTAFTQWLRVYTT